MSSASPADRTAAPDERVVSLIDTDVHLWPRDPDELIGYMAPRWRDRLHRRRTLHLREPFLPPREAFLPFSAGYRLDARVDGVAPGGDPELAKRQLLVETGTDFGLITPMVGHGPNPALNAAVFAAINVWQADTWLSEDDVRLFGSICVPLDDLPAAIAEIEHWGTETGFKQVLVSSDADRPFGHPQYEPLWRAAACDGLPVAVHFQESGRLQLGMTPVGPFERYIDFHALVRSLEYGAHLVSLICNDTFSAVPDLRFAFLEGGFLWHRPVVERLAHRWEDKHPSVGKDPFRCVREHVRFASQPLESAPVARDVARMLTLAGAAETLMFSSDYPHWDYDAPARVLPQGLGDHVRRRIMCENAREFYDLPATRRRDSLEGPAA